MGKSIHRVDLTIEYMGEVFERALLICIRKTDYTFLMMLEGKRFLKEGNWLSYFGEM